MPIASQLTELFHIEIDAVTALAVLQTSLLLMKSLNKTETPIFLSVVGSLFPKAIFLTFIYTVLKTVKEFYNKKRPSKGWSGVLLLHDNASSHKCEVVKSFLASEKVYVLNHPPYSPDLSLCDFFLIPRLKKMLSGNKYTPRSSLGSAIYRCL